MDTHPHQHFIVGIQERDEKVIQSIYQTFFPGIKGFILKNRGNEADAHDVFQEGMQMLYHEATTKDFNIHSGLNNWLFMVCRNVWYKKLKKNKQLPVTSDEGIDLKSEVNIDERIIYNEKKQLYLKKFQDLSDKCQSILTLFFEKTKMADIAEQLGYKNANVVKKKKSECQKRLTMMIQSDPLFKELSL